MDSLASIKLKESSTAYWNVNGGNIADNSSGFTLLPAGNLVPRNWNDFTGDGWITCLASADPWIFMTTRYNYASVDVSTIDDWDIVRCN